MELLDFLKEAEIASEQNVSLSKKTWVKTGGICACWITPNSVEQLVAVGRYLFANSLRFDIIGQTSNIFFHASYNPDIVVSTTQVNGYVIDGETITCDCGVSVVKLAKDCLSLGYAGFYGLVGLPGTVASAIFNNASCFECSLSSMLISADVLMPDGTVQTLAKDDFAYSHRSSAFKRGEKSGIILSVKLKAEKASNVQEECRKSEETVIYRREKQEHRGRNLGSVYASRRMKRNVKNIIGMAILKVLSMIKLLLNSRKAEKDLLLYLYGYQDLKPYVSDRNINTFIWKDKLAETKFARYKEFMGRVYDTPTIEIEERV